MSRIPDDVAELLCSICDNLGDMPISNEYAAKTSKRAYDLLKYKAITEPVTHQSVIANDNTIADLRCTLKSMNLCEEDINAAVEYIAAILK